MSQVVTIKDVAKLFGITYRGAQMRLKKVRVGLGKNTGQSTKKGGDPVTWDELYAYYNITKP